MTTHEPPPEAQLITRLREQRVPSLSMREAARRAGMSPALWTQNERGFRKVTAEVAIPVRATADKLASMALVVGGTPGQLRDAGRDDAAGALERLIEQAPDEYGQVTEAVEASRDLTDAQKRTLVEMIKRARDSTQ